MNIKHQLGSVLVYVVNQAGLKLHVLKLINLEVLTVTLIQVSSHVNLAQPQYIPHYVFCLL